MARNKDINHYIQQDGGNSNNSRRAVKYGIKKTFSIIFKAILSVLLVAFITGCIVGTSVLIFIMGLSDTRSDVDLMDLKLNLTSFIYVNDENGKPQEYQKLHSTENRIWVELDQIPDDLKNAFIAIEDKRFNEHQGVDWKRTFAAIGNLVGGESSFGGSTITQQLIKNITGKNDVSINRKLTEIFSALNLEKDFTKDQILEAYLNTIGLANGCNGVQTAANLYFGKDVKDCTLAECASIAAITQNPSRWNPLRFPEKNAERQGTILDEMYKQGYITKAQLDEALAQKMVFVGFKEEEKQTHVQNWYVDLLMSDVVKALSEELGMSESKASLDLYQGGLKIYSAMDLEYQTYCEEIYATNEELFGNTKEMQSAFFMMDYNGRVLATVGSRGEKTANRVLNRSTMSKRQPGSAIKPLSVYAPAIDADVITFSTAIEDQPLTIKGKNWPRNSYGKYLGDISVERALAKSSNAAPAQILENRFGLERSYDFLTKRLNFTSPYYKITIGGKVYSDVSLSALAVGGFTEGVTVREMVAGFQIFGNEGKYYNPYTFYYIENSDGEVILDNRNKTPMQAIGQDSATVMNKLLQGVVYSSEGTGRRAAIPGWTCFGKTGTTSSNYDRWFVGGTPEAVAGVWIGYDQNKTIAGSVNYAAVIWKELMSHYLEGKEQSNFNIADNVVSRTYCTATGKLAGGGCSNTSTGWYKTSNLPPVCDGIHKGEESSGESSDESSGESSGESSEIISNVTSEEPPVTSLPPPVSSEVPIASLPPVVSDPPVISIPPIVSNEPATIPDE